MPNLWPVAKKPQYGYKGGPEENIIRNDPQSAKFQEKDLWNRTIFKASMTFDLRVDDILTVFGFWKQMRTLAQAGQPYDFDFFDYDDDIYYDVLLGTTSGLANQVFDIPANLVRSYSWKKAGVLQSNSGITILAGTGVNGRDQMRITAAQTAGQAITMSYIGRGCFDCVFLKKPERTSIAFKRQSLQVDIMEKV
jgi:hypothetical protein